MTDTEILDFLQSLVVDTIYLDSGEIIQVGGLDVREAVIAIVGRNRCEKCNALLNPSEASAAGFCQDCEPSEAAQ